MLDGADSPPALNAVRQPTQRKLLWGCQAAGPAWLWKGQEERSGLCVIYGNGGEWTAVWTKRRGSACTSRSECGHPLANTLSCTRCCLSLQALVRWGGALLELAHYKSGRESTDMIKQVGATEVCQAKTESCSASESRPTNYPRQHTGHR